jgi:hypothetical protein
LLKCLEKNITVDFEKIEKAVEDVNMCGMTLNDHIDSVKFLPLKFGMRFNETDIEKDLLKELRLNTTDDLIPVLENLINNDNMLVNHVLRKNGLSKDLEISNNLAKNFFKLAEYYENHRSKYLNNTGSFSSYSTTPNGIKISIADDYNKVNIDFNTNNFDNFKDGIHILINAINKLDKEIVENSIKTMEIEKGKATTVRRDLKKDILRLADKLSKKLTNVKCGEKKNGDLKKLANKYKEKKKYVEKNLKYCINIHDKTIKEFNSKIEHLTGPSTDCCILKTLPGLIGKKNIEEYI